MTTSANENIVFAKKVDWKLSGIENEQCDNSTDTILNISNEGEG